MSELELTWTQQNPSFNTYRDDVFPSMVAVGNRSFILFQTNGNIRNGDGFKGGYDVALFEVDLSGDVQGSYQRKEWNTSGISRISHQSIATDGESLYFTYWTKGSVPSSPKVGRRDIVVVKTTLNGVIEWVIQDTFPNSSETNMGSTIIAEPSGNVYIAHLTNGLVPDYTTGKPVPRTRDKPQNEMELVITKLNSDDGSVLWTRQHNALNPEEGSVGIPSIDVNTGGDIFIGYSSSGALPGELKQSRSSLDIILARLSGNTGDIIWIKQDGDLNSDLTNTTPIIRVNANDIYITYSSSGLIQGGTEYKTSRTGNTDLVVARLDTNGNALWVRQRENFNSFGNDTPYSLEFLNGNVFVSYTVSILAKNRRKILREDAVVLKLSEYGDIVLVKYDDFLNYQSIGYIHQAPKLLAFNEGNTILTCYGFFNMENTVIYNQQFNGTIFQTKSDLVLKRFDVPDNLIGGSGFKVWDLKGSAINTSGRDISPYVVSDSSFNVYTLFKTNGSLSGYSLKGSYDISLFKTDKDGQIIWKKQNSEWNTAGKVTLSKQPILNVETHLYIAYSTRRFALDGQAMRGIEDIVLLKVDDDGNTVWTEQTALPNTQKRNTQPVLSKDTDDNLYIAFATDGEIDIYQGTVSQSPVKTGRPNDINIVIFKFNTSSRSVVWTLQHPLLNCPFGSISQLNIAVSDGIVLSYIASGALTDSLKESLSSTDVILAKLDFDGNLLWRKQNDDINSILTNSMPCLTVDSNTNDILLAYNTSGHVRDTGVSNYKGSTDMIVSKFDTNGNVVWKSLQSSINTFSQDTPSQVLTDSSNIYVSSTTYRATIDNTKTQREDVVLTKLDSSGQLIFAIQDGTFNRRIGSFRHVEPKIVLDGNGGVITTFGVSNFGVSRTNKEPVIDRGFSLGTRAIGDTTQDDEDITIVKTTDDTSGTGEGNITQTNDGTGDTGEVAEEEEDPEVETFTSTIAKGAVLFLPITLRTGVDVLLQPEIKINYDHSFNVRLPMSQTNAGLFSSLIQYIHVTSNEYSPHRFHFVYNNFVKNDLINSILNDIKTQKGELRRTDSDLPEFASGTTIENNTLGVLFLQYFADVLFGHPMAQAPIKNDNEIIQNIQEDSKLNEQFVDGVTENLLERGDYIEADLQTQATSYNEPMNLVLRQMITQVSDRFIVNDDVPEIIPFEPGDEVSMLIEMNGKIRVEDTQNFIIEQSQYFSKPTIRDFLKNVLDGYNIDTQYVDVTSTDFLVTKNWKLTFVLA